MGQYWELVNLDAKERFEDDGGLKMPRCRGEELVILLTKAKPPSDEALTAAYKAGEVHLDCILDGSPSARSGCSSRPATAPVSTSTTSSSLQALPVEIIRDVAKILSSDPRRLGDLVSFAFTCQTAFEEAKTCLKQAVTKCSGPWRGARIALIGDSYNEDQLPLHLRLSDGELLPFDPLDDEEDGPSFRNNPTIYRASRKFSTINPLSVMQPAADFVFLEIERMQRLGMLSTTTARQMLAMAYPTWHLLFPSNLGRHHALCFPAEREYVLSSDVLQEHRGWHFSVYDDEFEIEDSQVSEQNDIAYLAEKFDQDEPSARLAATPENAHLLALKIIGERIRDGLILSDQRIRRGPLAGRAMEIITVDDVASDGSWKRLSVQEAFPSERREEIELYTSFVDWRYPREVICQYHGCFLRANLTMNGFVTPDMTNESVKSEYLHNLRKMPHWYRKARNNGSKRVFNKGCEVCGEPRSGRTGTSWGQASIGR